MEGPTGELVGVDVGALSILPVPPGYEIVVCIQTVYPGVGVPRHRLGLRFGSGAQSAPWCGAGSPTALKRLSYSRDC